MNIEDSTDHSFIERIDDLHASMQSASFVASRVAVDYDWDGRDKTVMSYIDKTHTNYQLQWVDVETVHLLFNIDGNHWVMVCIDFKGKLIV